MEVRQYLVPDRNDVIRKQNQLKPNQTIQIYPDQTKPCQSKLITSKPKQSEPNLTKLNQTQQKIKEQNLKLVFELLK